MNRNRKTITKKQHPQTKRVVSGEENPAVWGTLRGELLSALTNISNEEAETQRGLKKGGALSQGGRTVNQPADGGDYKKRGKTFQIRETGEQRRVIWSENHGSLIGNGNFGGSTRSSELFRVPG